jgi:hypothetical protein
MNLYVPLGSAPESGRIRLYKIGGSADVEEVWSLYHCSTLRLCAPREEFMGLGLPSRPCVPSQPPVGALARALFPMLKCCGGVQRPPGGGRRHHRGPVGPSPCHRWWQNERWRAGSAISPHTMGTLAARARAASIQTHRRVDASQVDGLRVLWPWGVAAARRWAGSAHTTKAGWRSRCAGHHRQPTTPRGVVRVASRRRPSMPGRGQPAARRPGGRDPP